MPAFCASAALLAAGRALISGSLEAWYVDSLRLLDPAAPLSHGLSRGAAAEGVAMAVGSLIAGGLVTLAGPAHGGGGAFSGYGIAALAGALAAVAYLIAVALLVDEGDRRVRAPGRPAPVRRQVAEILATARDEFMGSVAVRVVVVTGRGARHVVHRRRAPLAAAPRGPAERPRHPRRGIRRARRRVDVRRGRGSRG